MRRFFCLIMVLVTIFFLVGCSSDASCVYSVNATGDKILAKINKSSGLSFSFSESVVVVKDGEILSRVVFMKKERYYSYLDEVNNDELSSIIYLGNKEGNEYMFWKCNECEWNCIMLVKDSNTAVFLSNAVSEESAKECFENLTFSYYSKVENENRLKKFMNFF